MRSRVTEQLHQILEQSLKTPDSHAKGLGPDSASSSPLVIPRGFSPHDYAVFLLHVAAEIEHGLLIQYLFAAYSLGGPQVPEVDRSKVVRWQAILLGIAREEMGHLITVQNLLKLIGGPLNLERDDFPWDLPFYPFPFALEPLSAKLIARYVCIESPNTWPDNWAAKQKEIEHLAFPNGSDGFNRVGRIYGNLKTLFADKALMPDSCFHADTLPYQASFDEWGRGYAAGARGAASPGAATPDVLIYTAYSRKTALDALDAIAEQGEAADAVSQEKDLSHFERFMELYQEFSAEPDPSKLCRPVVGNPRVVGEPDAVPNTTYIAYAPSRYWAELLNLRYRMLLTFLAHSFRISGGAGGYEEMTRGAVLNRAFGEMYNLRAIANILVTLPAIDVATPSRAAPTFELPYTLTLPYLERDVWGLHLDLIKASEDLIAQVKGTAGNDGDAFLTSLLAIDGNAAATFRSALNDGFNRSATRTPGGLS
ncbi:ferritin-like protein (plasmid) [Rhizobium sp. CB3171]|uniref:ferritin-like domain-containing protein n=1 Tax=Rhizobium sp. CB3171 TaxID=3039157 RepID=UPI0024B092FB|nr:ferritin-like protein [Rhizobium sp. CB3171]WFU07488.1 ferritin-like protein [Rhizobium sp. CB3171]